VRDSAATVVFSIALQESGGLFDYFFSSTGQIDHPAGNTENNVLVDVTFTATGRADLPPAPSTCQFDDDIPVRASNPTPVTATVEEDGMSSAVTRKPVASNGDDQSLGNPGAGDSLADDQASGAVGSLTALVDVGADQPGTMTLSSVTTSLPTLFSKGQGRHLRGHRQQRCRHPAGHAHGHGRRADGVHAEGQPGWQLGVRPR
jgi:hypothetical protein